MKITSSQLRQIIMEEIKNVVEADVSQTDVEEIASEEMSHEEHDVQFGEFKKLLVTSAAAAGVSEKVMAELNSLDDASPAWNELMDEMEMESGFFVPLVDISTSVHDMVVNAISKADSELDFKTRLDLAKQAEAEAIKNLESGKYLSLYNPSMV